MTDKTAVAFELNTNGAFVSLFAQAVVSASGMVAGDQVVLRNNSTDQVQIVSCSALPVPMNLDPIRIGQDEIYVTPYNAANVFVMTLPGHKCTISVEYAP